MDAVVFDCDGVLVDSEPASVRAWMQALAARDVDVDEAEIAGWIGRTDRAMAEHYADRTRLGSDQLLDRVGTGLLELLDGGAVERFDDAVGLLDTAVERGLLVAVATNSVRWRLDAVLRAASLDHLIPLSVAADEVGHPKPAPDLYLAALDMLGVEGTRTLVIEDTPTGVAAARAAGCRVVAVDRGVFDADAFGEGVEVVVTLE